MPKKYRKKPIVVEALKVRYGDTASSDVREFAGSYGALGYDINTGLNYIRTFEGKMVISDGDYLIKGIQGEFYPCKPDIFEASYEAVNDTENTDFKHVLATMLSVYPDNIDKREGSVLYDLFAPLAMSAVIDTAPDIIFNVSFARPEVDTVKIVESINRCLNEEFLKGATEAY